MGLIFIVGSFRVAFSSLIVLIIIDLATKWLSFSYKCLIDSGMCKLKRRGLYDKTFAVIAMDVAVC